MLKLKHSTCVLLILLVSVRLSRNASLSVQEQKKYKDLIEGQGLYSQNDDVEILTKANFKKRVYGQENAILVEFYNSWCGFCQRFAPSWKALGTDTKSWRGGVNIAAIDCADDENSELCRYFEIMAYPTLRYFHEDYTEGPKNFGADVLKGSDVEGHKRNLIAHMIKEQEANRGKQLPNLLPYGQPNLLLLFEGTNVNSKYVFLIIDKPKSILGPEIALDFHKYKQIGVRYATTDNSALVEAVHARSFPFMMVLTDTNQSHTFGEVSTREEIHNAIKEYVKPDIAIEDEDKKNIFTGKWIDAEVPDITSLMEAKSRKVMLDKIKKMGDVVFQVDLETALKFSLKHEIGGSKLIEGEKLTALRNFLTVLVKYFPASENGKVFLSELLHLVNSKNSIEGKEIYDAVHNKEDKSAGVFSSSHKWIGCEGSTPAKRGYPCGLWKLFHYLTIQSAAAEAPPKEVLNAMHGYIKNYFGCADCAQHFQEMAVNREMEMVNTTNSAILWLWMAHNDVNKRLSGDATEDSEFPKLQFPSPERCPRCRVRTDSWDYNEVLLYLKQVYSAYNIQYMGTDSGILHPELPTIRNASNGVFVTEKGISEKDVRS